MFSSSTPRPGSLARPASRLNYRGFLLPSPERQPRFTWREQRCSGASKEEFGEDDGCSERGGRPNGASSNILLFGRSLHRSPVKGAGSARTEHSAKTSREQVLTHCVPTG